MKTWINENWMIITYTSLFSVTTFGTMGIGYLLYDIRLHPFTVLNLAMFIIGVTLIYIVLKHIYCARTYSIHISGSIDTRAISLNNIVEREFYMSKVYDQCIPIIFTTVLIVAWMLAWVYQSIDTVIFATLMVVGANIYILLSTEARANRRLAEANWNFFSDPASMQPHQQGLKNERNRHE